MTYSIKSRVWISTPTGTFLGGGRVQLLEAIQAHGSISAAAKTMGISYRKAWKMIDVMNSQGSKPVVVRSSGGAQGGGTHVTPYGKELLNKYLSFHEECQEALDQVFKKYNFH